jgi:two-component system, cell cycle sensor histidine kinase and response regulator CckA
MQVGSPADAQSLCRELERRLRRAQHKLSEAEQSLADQINERIRAQRINRILFWISNAVNTTDNLEELYASIHKHLGTVIDLTNFYIALYDKHQKTISFPYYVDEVDNYYEYTLNFSETNSLTGEVISAGMPLLLREPEIRERVAENRILGTAPRVWIGVPLKIRDEVIGIISTQSYSDPDHFDRIDMEILNSASEQVALVIERKLYEQRLRESEEKYRRILANIEDGYYEVDLKGNFTFFNRAMGTILGYSADELSDLNFKQLADQANAAKIESAFERVMCSGQSTKTTDWQLTRKDGTVCFLECGVAAMTRADGAPVGFRGIARDVTERITAQQAHKRLEERLQQSQRLEALGKLAGGIAHDFNNLLMGIQGRTSLIMADTAENHPRFSQLRGIEDCVNSAANLTRRLLGFARGGKYDVKPANINHLVQKTAEMIGRAKKEIVLSTRLEKTAWNVEVDAHQIEQVLLNLFVNAWQAMPNGGSLTVETENLVLDPEESRVLGVQPGSFVRVSVTDTGLGMDKEILPRIFDPFFSTKDMGGGTGLGLASVYGILKNHHGAISVYSERGRGSTFKFYLPAFPIADTLEQAGAPGEIVKAQGIVLLVDDEAMVLEVGRDMLEMFGYTVLTASAGKDAIDIFQEKHTEIDFVILDMIMPSMGGGELYERLKQIRTDIKVLLSSGYSMNDQVLGILNKGCNGFIQKPFNIAQLKAKIGEMLRPLQGEEHGSGVQLVFAGSKKHECKGSQQKHSL